MNEFEFLVAFGEISGHFDTLEEKGLIETGPGGITHRRYGPGFDDFHVINRGYKMTSKGLWLIMDTIEEEYAKKVISG